LKQLSSVKPDKIVGQIESGLTDVYCDWFLDFRSTMILFRQRQPHDRSSLSFFSSLWFTGISNQ